MSHNTACCMNGTCGVSEHEIVVDMMSRLLNEPQYTTLHEWYLWRIPGDPRTMARAVLQCASQPSPTDALIILGKYNTLDGWCCCIYQKTPGPWPGWLCSACHVLASHIEPHTMKHAAWMMLLHTLVPEDARTMPRVAMQCASKLRHAEPVAA